MDTNNPGLTFDGEVSFEGVQTERLKLRRKLEASQAEIQREAQHVKRRSEDPVDGLLEGFH